jgi:bifunctional DNA-binding transcriptional regulator/antitoxin component of YhaV-PrlF toxin-antitoxin module
MVAVSGRYLTPQSRNVVLWAPLSPTAWKPADAVTGVLRSQPASLPHPGSGAELRIPPGLPIPVLHDAARRAGACCVATPVDRDGRLADRSALTFMDWSAGQAVELAIEPGPIVVARTVGSVRIDPRGHLRLPLTVRRRCGIATGDRVLVVANQRWGELLVIPMATVDEMVSAYRHSPDSGAGR